MNSKAPLSDNAIEFLKEELMKSVKEALTERLVQEELARYEVKVRDLVKPYVAQITFESLKRVSDVMRAREELHVFLRIKDSAEQIITKEVL